MPDQLDPSEPTLSVIVPVYDQAEVIVENVRTICARVGESLEGTFEVIVVSDGSIDMTAERVLASEIKDVRVLHYDRNLGKGYAVRTGAREARGRWVAYIDADLDLDPASLPTFVAVAEAEQLDFVIGSKRHPDSTVYYPRSRVVASWLFQQLVRVLFRLKVRDTQVGLKVIRREVVDEVFPFLLIKRFAFDIELLAVARAFGYRRLREMPVRLDYRFTGSGVRSTAVAFALLDTFAIFYRLRLRHYYQRQRRRDGAAAWVVPREFEGTVEVIEQSGIAARRRAAEASDASILAFLEPGSRPSANWLSATLPFFRWPELAVVVMPQLAPAGGSVRERAAASVGESRIGGGSLYFRFTPGRIRFVRDFPARSFLIRRERFLALPATMPPEAVVRHLAGAARAALYVPEVSVTSNAAPLFVAHLRRIATYGRGRGELLRTHRSGALRPSTVGVIALLGWTLGGWVLILAGALGLEIWLAVWGAYLAVIAIAAAFGGLRFHSGRVGFATGAGLLLTHFVYTVSLVYGLARVPAPLNDWEPDGRRIDRVTANGG